LAKGWKIAFGGAVKQIVAWQLDEAMRKQKISEN